VNTLATFWIFLQLGLTSFGGPIAHLGYFRTEFVEKRRWLDDAAFTDLVALCQFLPGPASSQVGFALGLRRAGLPGGVAAWLGFTAPSAIFMLAVALGLAWFATPEGQAVAHGLKLVAVAVVAHAVYGMARNLCSDRMTAAIAVVSLTALLLSAIVWAQPVLILLGGLIGVCFPGKRAEQPAPPVAKAPLFGPLALLTLFFALLVGLPLAAAYAPTPLLETADAFYRSGALVFGGGHVVLPLLEHETVGRGWLGADQFLAGYGAVQAAPGPLFTFAAFLGAAAAPLHGGVAFGLVALVAVFLPGLLLVAAALPLWDKLKSRSWTLGFVRGANAAVVGILGAALYTPVFTSGVLSAADAAVATLGFVALQAFKAPPWLVVLLVGGAGTALTLAPF
jgi:chromate transporter